MRPSSVLTCLLAIDSAAAVTRQVSWNSSGTQIVGYHHMPACHEVSTPLKFAPPVPAIILAHGLGGIQIGGLQPFAEQFASLGYHAITFDYRHWGFSDGEPRNLADIDLQRGDWYAAIAAARKIRGIDPRRIILWGTSLSGGMVLQLGASAYNDPSSGVVGIISQVPTVNGPASAALTEPGTLPELLNLAFADQARRNSTLTPIYVPICNHTGQLGLLTQPGALEGCHHLLPNPPAPEFGNITARFVLQFPSFSPDTTAAQSHLPTFIGIAMGHNIVSVNSTIALAARMPNIMTRRYAGAGHFDVYPNTSYYDENLSSQVAFLQKFFPIKSRR